MESQRINILNCKLSLLDLQNVRPSVPLYLLQFLSDSFNIAHRASLQCRGRHGRNFFFFFGSFSGHFLPFLGLSVRPSVRTTISPAVVIGFFQYRTQGIITMSRASWEKLFFFRVIFGPFSAIFRPFRPSVPLYLLQFL